MKNRNNQKSRILAMLKEAGSKGVTFAKIIGKIYIVDYRRRITDLRREGHNIVSARVEGKQYFNYVMQEG